MTASHNSPVVDAPRPRRRWLKRLMWLMIALAAVGGMGWAVVYGYVGPKRVRTMTLEGLRRRWAGPIEIGRGEFRLRGPVAVRDVVFKDDAGRTWARVDRMELTVKNWPRASTQIAGITFRGAAITAHPGTRPPLVAPAGPADVTTLEMRSVFIDGCRVTFGAATDGCVTPDLSVRLHRRPLVMADGRRPWHIMVRVVDSDADEHLWGWLTSRRDPSGRLSEIAFDGRYARGERIAEIDVAFAPPPAGPMTMAVALTDEGDPQWGRATVTGRTDDLWADRVKLVGQATFAADRIMSLANWEAAVHSAGDTPNEALFVAVHETNALGGKASGLIRGRLGPNEPLQIWSRTIVADMELKQLARFFGHEQPDQGTLRAGEIYVYNEGVRFDAPHAAGALHATGMSTGRIALFRQIGQALGPNSQALGGHADAVTIFSLVDNIATIQLGRMADRLVALDVEKGSTVRMDTGQLNLFVSGGLMSQLRPALQMLPMMNWAANIADALVYMHVTGTLDEPVITPRPARALTTNAMNFMKLATNFGGDFGAMLTGRPQGLLRSLSSDAQFVWAFPKLVPDQPPLPPRPSKDPHWAAPTTQPTRPAQD